MKKINIIPLLFCLIIFAENTGCKKETVQGSNSGNTGGPGGSGSGNTNKPPIARAGNDTTIMLPVNGVYLNGSGSHDPDNNIASYHWSKLSGPGSFSIASANSAITGVTNLVKGNYEFLLKVMDSLAEESVDTIRVIVETILLPPPPATGYNVYIRPHDTTLSLPVNTISLRAETWSWTNQPIQPAIREIVWRKVAGPDNYVFQQPNALITSVTNMASGMYAFECKVTDSSGFNRSGYTVVHVMDTIDTLIPGQEVIIPDLNWDAHLGEPWVNIDLSKYIPTGRSIKKLFIKRDCDTSFRQVPLPWTINSPNSNFFYSLGWQNNAFNLWVYHLNLEPWCVVNDTPDIKIVY